MKLLDGYVGTVKEFRRLLAFRRLVITKNKIKEKGLCNVRN